MVFFVLLGIIDVFFAVLMVLTHLGLLHKWRLAFMGAAYLIGKGFLLRGSFLSFIDMAAGVYFILIMFGLKTFLVYVFLAVMIYKFIASLVMR
ncbi:MAG: hypothetical protein V1866_04650 [archaeon]